MPVEMHSRQRKYSLPTERLVRATELALEELKGSSETISIVFVNDRTIRAINKQYRHKDRATDVLSFRYDREPVPFLDKGPDGEILISVETAERQARELGIPLSVEILNLIIHGVCHVFGYDHETGQRDADIMRKMERRIAGKIIKDFGAFPGTSGSGHESAPSSAKTIRGKIPDIAETRKS